MDGQAYAKLRLDKWLWYARLLKTRSLATKFIQSGYARVNREKISSASHGVKVGDILTLALYGRIRVLEVTALAERRGSAPEAALLYKDIAPQPAAAGTDPALPPDSTTPSPDRRPDKRERRRIGDFKDGFR